MSRAQRLGLVGAVVLGFGVIAAAQVKNADLSAKLTAVRAQNAALMQQYSWTSRAELVKDDKVRDIRLESVTFGPDGKPQRTLINDQGSSLPRGFLRRAVAENERKETEKYLKGLRDLLDRYTLPTAGRVLDFVSQATITTAQDASGGPVVRISGSGVVDPGDSLVLDLDPGSSATRRMAINSRFEGSAVNATVTFKTTPSGLNHVEFAEISVPDKSLSLQVHEFDFERSQ